MVKKAFGSQELCNKMWRNASMLGGDRVRKEKLKIKCPKRIQFGDPLYYEDFKNEPERQIGRASCRERVYRLV